MRTNHQAIVIGTSAGGLHALTALFATLPVNYPIPIIVTQHRSNDHKDLLEEVLQGKCKIKIRQANEKEQICAGFVYTAPPGYHLLLEEDKTFSLSADEHVSYSKPSIDVLFETAADAYKDKLVGIILTGANSDGANGIAAIKRNRGLTIAQDPTEAEYPVMPLAAINKTRVDHVWKLAAIRKFLGEIDGTQNTN